MMHQKGSLMSPLLNGVFCQCDSSESHRGADPGGGGHADDDTSPEHPLPGQPSVSASDTDDHCHSSHPCELCGGPEQEHRLKVLFQVLDVNGDGGICVNDLTIGLKRLGVHRTENELRVRASVGLYSVSSLACENKQQKQMFFVCDNSRIYLMNVAVATHRGLFL